MQAKISSIYLEEVWKISECCSVDIAARELAYGIIFGDCAQKEGFVFLDIFLGSSKCTLVGIQFAFLAALHEGNLILAQKLVKRGAKVTHEVRYFLARIQNTPTGLRCLVLLFGASIITRRTASFAVQNEGGPKILEYSLGILDDRGQCFASYGPGGQLFLELILGAAMPGGVAVNAVWLIENFSGLWRETTRYLHLHDLILRAITMCQHALLDLLLGSIRHGSEQQYQRYFELATNWQDTRPKEIVAKHMFRLGFLHETKNPDCLHCRRLLKEFLF